MSLRSSRQVRRKSKYKPAYFNSKEMGLSPAVPPLQHRPSCGPALPDPSAQERLPQPPTSGPGHGAGPGPAGDGPEPCPYLALGGSPWSSPGTGWRRGTTRRQRPGRRGRPAAGGPRGARAARPRSATRAAPAPAAAPPAAPATVPRRPGRDELKFSRRKASDGLS